LQFNECNLAAKQQLSRQTVNIVKDNSKLGVEVGLCKWWLDKRSTQYVDKFSIYCTLLQTCQILSLAHCDILIVCFVDHCCCHMSCTFSHIIIPELSWFLRGFLPSRTALPFTEYFAYALIPSLWWNARYSYPVSLYSDQRQCWHWSENTFHSIPFCMTTRNSKYISTASLKVSIGSWKDHSVDSGSCSW